MNNYFLNSRSRSHHLSPIYASNAPCQYSHFVDLDIFYEDRTRITVSLDEKRRNCPPVSVRKRLIKSLDISCGSQQFDIRFTAKEELPVSLDSQKYNPEVMCSHSRKKDRISYQFNLWSLDLTKVEWYTAHRGMDIPMGMSPHKVTYELELELADPSRLHSASPRINSWVMHVAYACYNSLRQLNFICRTDIPLPRSCQVPKSHDRKRKLNPNEIEQVKKLKHSN